MEKITAFLRNNWFKIAIAVLLIFIAFKKDISLQMNMNAPVDQVPMQTERPVSREKFTDQALSRKASTKRVLETERLDLQPFRKEEDMAVVQEVAALPAPMREAFIQRFGKVAQAEQEKFGIPASIVLGNAMLISRSGESMQVKLGLNFFGLTCTPDWQGEKGEIEGKCVRYYESAWMSFRDHSLYITTGKFSKMRTLGGTDYATWAKALEKEGFQPVPNYARQVLKLIEQYQLSRWD